MIRVLLLAGWAACAGGMHQEVPTMEPSMEEQVDRLLASEGEEYRQVEAELRRERESARSILEREQQDGPDPFARFVARAVLELPEDEAVFGEAEEFLARTERRLTGTILGGPRPDVVAEDLAHLYGQRLVGYFAVHLVKEDADWPRWKSEAVLLYLAREGGAGVLPALARFATVADEPDLRRLAMATAARFPNEAPAVLAEEERFWQSHSAAGPPKE